VSLLVDIQEYETPNIDRELSTGAALDAPLFCLPVLCQLDYLFVGRCGSAPALRIAGGILSDGTPVSGAGAAARSALTRLAGEAAEQLALRQPPPLAPGALQPATLALPATALPPLRATCWRSGKEVAVAASALPDGSRGHTGYSEGLAAHTDPALALRHGVGELVERHAVRLWWAGARQGRHLSGTQALTDEVLGPERVRRTILLDLTGEIELPVILAASFDARGREFCFGAAAGASGEAAARAALRELGASEFGLSLARQNAEAGRTDETGDLRRAAVVRHEPFMELLAAPGEHALPPNLPDWGRLYAALDIHAITLPLPDTGFTALKTLSGILQAHGACRLRDLPGAKNTWDHGPFGVPIY
jgi:hypothetical protein